MKHYKVLRVIVSMQSYSSHLLLTAEFKLKLSSRSFIKPIDKGFEELVKVLESPLRES